MRKGIRKNRNLDVCTRTAEVVISATTERLNHVFVFIYSANICGEASVYQALYLTLETQQWTRTFALTKASKCRAGETVAHTVTAMQRKAFPGLCHWLHGSLQRRHLAQHSCGGAEREDFLGTAVYLKKLEGTV